MFYKLVRTVQIQFLFIKIAISFITTLSIRQWRIDLNSVRLDEKYLSTLKNKNDDNLTEFAKYEEEHPYYFDRFLMWDLLGHLLQLRESSNGWEDTFWLSLKLILKVLCCIVRDFRKCLKWRCTYVGSGCRWFWKAVFYSVLYQI